MPPIAFPTDTTAIETLADNHQLLGDDGTMLRDITALVVAQYIAAKGLAPAGGTPLAVALAARIAATEKGAANGVAPLDSTGKVPAGNLPSYVDDVLEFANQAAFPGAGEAGKLYVALDTNAMYRWSGSAYANMGAAPAYATQAQAVAGTDNSGVMTALRVAQAVDPKLAKKADVVNASPIVPAGVTTLTRTAVTTAGAEAPTGYFNRPLLTDHDLIIDPTGVQPNDAVMAVNIAATPKTITVGGVTVTMQPGKFGEVAYTGSAWTDPSTAGGVSYTDEQVRDVVAAMLAAGTHSGLTITNNDAGDAINFTASGAGIQVFKLAPVADISPGATTEVLLFDQVISGLTALSEVEASLRGSAVGSGTKNFRMLVGGDAGVVNGTQVALASTAGAGVTQRQNIGFIVNGGATGVIGQSPNIVSYGTTSTANPAVTIPVAGLRVKITAVKSAAADTLNFDGGQVRVFA